MRGTSKKLIMQDCKSYARNENSRIFVYALREKCPNTEFFLVRIFPSFGLNTEIYAVNLRIQSEYGEIRTRKNFVFGHFSRSV